MIFDHLAGNNARFGGSGVSNAGTMIILNSTVADNNANDILRNGGGSATSVP